MIDLHCHSTCSDGTLTPEEIAERGRAFSVFALTDHDTLDGVGRFLAASRDSAGLRLAGIELSVKPGTGYAKFHLLGLGVDPASPRLNAFLDEIRAGRDERNVKIAARLAELGYPLEMEELRRYANGRILARPHFARVLMDHGWAESVKDAFSRLLGDGAPAYVPRWTPSQRVAIETVHAAGGVAVMAHPRYWTGDREALKAGLARLKDFGLDGVEAVYQANSPGETVEHLRIARELGLAVTAGSDFHGANKPEIRLGMEVDDDEAFLEPLLHRLRTSCQNRRMPSSGFADLFLDGASAAGRTVKPAQP
jgi:predicted metal-dependent phosphoesterase TrpH